MLKKMSKVKMHSYPGMVAVVGVRGEASPNFMAAGWHSYLSIDPPMYGVAVGKERYTYELLQRSERYSINFLPAEHAAFIQYAGTVSGRDKDKCGEFGQAYFISDKGNPILENAYLSYECIRGTMIPTGDHDWVVGDIETCYYIEDKFGTDGLPDFEKLHIPLYLGRSTYVPLEGHVKKMDIKDPLNYK
ncbi:flavin reductase family protein [Thalassobacillus hwangdonensis]|uniref:Flavin reductase family protein n=1 Tax=Thalassobacillus hwangdonensis TaxID=546108 RepID=A0ABW3L0U7_9BACI